MLGTGRSYLGFFLRGCGLTARGGRHGTWLSLKKVTMKGCLERGPLRPTNPIQPADRERSGRGSRDITAPTVSVSNGVNRPVSTLWKDTHPPLSPRRDVCPGCCGGGGASGWRRWWRRRRASPPVLQAQTACPAAPAPALWAKTHNNSSLILLIQWNLGPTKTKKFHFNCCSENF